MVSLQIIPICLLCIFRVQTLAGARESPGERCVSARRMKIRAEKLMKTYSQFRIFRMRDREETWDQQSCSGFRLQTASQEHNHRSLSPWRYRIQKDDNRIPSEIAVAECLCQGCIINHQEDFGYNSVPVMADFTVLTKTTCPGDPDRYVIRSQRVPIAVGCTCVVPRSTRF